MITDTVSTCFLGYIEGSIGIFYALVYDVFEKNCYSFSGFIVSLWE